MDNINYLNLIGQAFGIFALFLSCLRYFRKKKTDLFKFSLFAYACYIVHYALIGALAGSYTLVIAIFRDYYIYLREKHHKKHRHRAIFNNVFVFIAFATVYISLIFLNLENPINTLPLVAGFTYLFFEWFITNKTTLKLAGGLTTLPWLVFDIASFSIAAINDVVQILASLTGVLKDKKLRKKVVKHNH